MVYTPLMIDLAEKLIVIVGGGRVAERRVDSLIDSGANLTIVSPEINEKLHTLWRQELITWKKKLFEPIDIKHTFLVIAATNHREVNLSIRESVPNEKLLNMAGDAELGNVEFPGTYRQGDLTISVSTNGASPMLTSKIKKELESKYDSRYEQYVSFLSEYRKLIKQSSSEETEKHALLKRLLAEEFLSTDKQCSAIKHLKEMLKK